MFSPIDFGNKRKPFNRAQNHNGEIISTLIFPRKKDFVFNLFFAFFIFCPEVFWPFDKLSAIFFAPFFGPPGRLFGIFWGWGGGYRRSFWLKCTPSVHARTDVLGLRFFLHWIRFKNFVRYREGGPPPAQCSKMVRAVRGIFPEVIH